MSDINAKLDELKAELAALEKADAGEAPPETVEMNPTQFAAHLATEVAALKKSTGDERKARLAYLNEIIDIGKNFEGPTPGAQSIPIFKDPAQSTHTTASPSVPTTQPSGTNFSQDAGVPPTGTPTPPSAGGMPPTEAGPSGAPFAGGNFAKSVDAKLDELKQLVKSATEAAAAAAPTAPAAPPAAPVAKARDNAWPLDMNTKVGLGKSETEEEPEHFFGWDHGSALEAETASAADKS